MLWSSVYACIQLEKLTSLGLLLLQFFFFYFVLYNPLASYTYVILKINSCIEINLEVCLYSRVKCGESDFC